ncbi:MAG: methyltransferase domain-containing protein [Burkholderiales bacterium]|nr:methyltransferase domain-containing protein [Burkholderiales bacterium]
MPIYEHYILPPLLHCVCGMPLLARHRATLIPGARGQVVEIGIGSALNTDYYDADKINSLIGIDPSQQLLRYARKRVTKLPFTVSLIPALAESLPLPDACADTVVVTFSLCTIPDTATALAEMRRVLKPSGRLLFCEHGLAADGSVQRWQRRLEPVWGKLAGGCHLTRNVPQLLADAGFFCDELETGYLRHAPRFAGYIYRGSAAARPAN